MQEALGERRRIITMENDGRISITMRIRFLDFYCLELLRVWAPTYVVYVSSFLSELSTMHCSTSCVRCEAVATPHNALRLALIAMD